MNMRARLMMLAGVSVLLLLFSIAGSLYQLYDLKNDLAANQVSIHSLTNAAMTIELAQVAFKTQVQDWKDMLIRGNDAASYEKYFSQFEKEEKQVQTNLQNAIDLMRKQGLTTTDTEILMDAHTQLGSQYRDALKSYDNPSCHL